MPHPMMNSHARRETRESRRERRALSGMIGTGLGALITLTILYPEPAGYVWAFLALSTAAAVVFRQVVQEIEKIDATPPPGVPVACSEVYPGDFASREEYEAFKRTSKYTDGEDVIKEETDAYLAEITRREASRPQARRERVSRRIELEINNAK